jgi:hypothetical protein
MIAELKDLLCIDFPPNSIFHFFTDSLSMLSALGRGPIRQNDDSGDEIWDLLRQLVEKGAASCHLHFIYSHCGFLPQDDVDTDAGKATSLPQRHVPVWHTDMLCKVRNMVDDDRVQRQPETFRTAVLGPSRVNTRWADGLSRADQVAVTRLRLGETPFCGKFLRRTGEVTSKACRWCHPEAHRPEPRRASSQPPARAAHDPPAAPPRLSALDPHPCPVTGCEHIASRRPNLLVHLTGRHDLPLNEARALCGQTAYNRSRTPTARIVPPPVALLAPAAEGAAVIGAEPPRPTFPCPGCGKAFKSQGGRTVHQRAAGSQPACRAVAPARAPELVDTSYWVPPVADQRGDPPTESVPHVLVTCGALSGVRQRTLPAELFVGLSEPSVVLSQLFQYPRQVAAFVSAADNERHPPAE